MGCSTNLAVILPPDYPGPGPARAAGTTPGPVRRVRGPGPPSTMPELPECEAQRRMLERCAVGRVITSLCATEQGTGARAGDFDDKIFDEGADAAAVEEALVGRRVAAARRRGKQIWLAFDDGSALLLHLGMTGSCVVLGEATPSYKAFQVDQAWPPKCCRPALPHL